MNSSPSFSRIRTFLEKPTDIAPLVYARVVLGVLISLEFSLGLFTNYAQTLIHGEFHFSYILTPFITPWSSETLMYAHFVLNFVLGICFAAGLFYRWIAPLFLISGASLFLMEKTLYINHFYLYSLILFLFLFLPANRAFSLDARRKQEIRVSEVPAWNVYLLLLQLSIAYFYAGIAKLNADWFQAQPVQIWLSHKADYPVIGSLLSSTSHAYFVAYGGIVFDLLIVPFMIWKKTRKVAFGLACFFHLSNVITFGVGTFPWFSMAATALFFPAISFRKILFRGKLNNALLPSGSKSYSYGNRQRLIFGFLSLFMVVQLLLPLRQHLYPGNTSWNEEGHFFAWRMMLRDKQATISFRVKDSETGKVERIDLQEHLNNRQIRKMAGHSDLILQFAHYLKHHYETEKGFTNAQVFAKNRVSLNGRPYQNMIQPNTDLGAQPRTFRHYDWIVPLEDFETISQ